MLYDVVMGHFISRWLILTVAAGVMVAVLPGMHAIGEPPVLGIAAFALFMALINASIKPIIHVIALPFSIVSFGLVALVINWLFMQLASWLALSFFSVGVTIDGFVLPMVRVLAWYCAFSIGSFLGELLGAKALRSLMDSFASGFGLLLSALTAFAAVSAACTGLLLSMGGAA